MFEATAFVLRFSETSAYPGQLVALDRSSGGYPYAVGENPFRAQRWEYASDALNYADSFTAHGGYRDYAIEPKVYSITCSVEEV